MAEDDKTLDGDGSRKLEESLTAFIESELLSPQMTIGRDDDLLSGELLDSVAVLRLATFVQEEFQMNMPPSDFVVENFQTVAVLAQYVRKSLCKSTGS